MTKKQLAEIRERAALGNGLRFGSQLWQSVEDRKALLEEVDRLISVVTACEEHMWAEGLLMEDSLEYFEPPEPFNIRGTNHASTGTGGSRQEETSP